MSVQSLIERQTLTLAGGATSAVIPHTLHDPNGALIPNFVWPTKISNVRPIAVTSVGVTYINDGITSETVTFVLRYDMTPQRSSDQGLAGLQNLYAGAGALAPGGGTAAGISTDPALDLTVFLDGINGLDTNNGLTALTAKQTYMGIINAFPQILVGGPKILVSIAGTGGFGINATAPLTYTEPTFLIPGPGGISHNGWCVRACERVPANPTTGPTTAALDVVPAVEINQANAAAPGTGFRTRLDFTAAAPGWTANNFRNSRFYVRIRRAGVDVIPETPIVENTASSLTIDVLCVAQILSTDTVEIVRQGVEFTGPAADLNQHLITGGGAPDPFDVFGIGVGNGNTIEGVAFIGRPVFQSFVGGLDRCAASGLLILFEAKCELVLMQCKFQLATQMYGYSVFNRQPGQFRAVSPVNPIFQTPAFRQALAVVGTMSIGDPRGGFTVYQVDDVLSKYGGTSLRVWGGGSALSTAGSGTANILGSGASASGLHARYGAKIIANGGTRTQITGTAGALRVGPAASATVAYGVGVGAWEQVAGFNGNFYRMNGSVAISPTGDDSQIMTPANA